METPTNAGDWRLTLRREASDSARWQALWEAAVALRQVQSPEQACDAVLGRVLLLLGLEHGAVLAQRGPRAQVLASRGLALPPGANAAGDGHEAAWWMPPRPSDIREARVPIHALGTTHGMLCVAWSEGRPAPGNDDVQALQPFALLLAMVAELAKPVASRRRKPLQDDRLAALSKREKQVLSLLPRGLTNATLAAELGISPGTVKVHVERILQKLEVKDRTQAAVYAVQSGLAL
ncbi:response regulator transcription factor [Xanthomonas axonopodis pv. vasculorum]|uniref:LuxR family transcriptional regulator n=1 Tax=Xanthomonas axonopodis pv. vasculorum TaxID=325777 RepID=A0A098Q2B3_9XANT|nr:response regulator transcription factor [Xanthomonas axonopodis]KGE53136.1 LuxR family transcriptional regulator [Xanthomonas axonopodis pv. vasculorum]PPV09720.1 helix-turn-helix transcriptional regulator [Xanthomonas axonopodis pv. vasculorum]QKD87694.1 response regulator transcription factor [Xanthomonas axonopodis pv. vasculorum]